jgi:hypothetical protein
MSIFAVNFKRIQAIMNAKIVVFKLVVAHGDIVMKDVVGRTYVNCSFVKFNC